MFVISLPENSIGCGDERWPDPGPYYVNRREYGEMDAEVSTPAEALQFPTRAEAEAFILVGARYMATEAEELGLWRIEEV